MIEQLDYTTLQHLWWLLCSIVGALFLFLNFVQGGQSLLWQVGKTETERDLIINSLGRKWELTFTTLVLFGGALFASFPKFYSTSFGGAYWVWILILLTFVVQAVSYEYRSKPWNILGSRGYEGLLFINGVFGPLLIGVAVGTFYTGANFTLDSNNFVTWAHPFRGLEAALTPSYFSVFNLALGLFLVFNARTLGAMYLVNNIEFGPVPELEQRLRAACWQNFLISLPLCGLIVLSLLFLPGYAIVDDQGTIAPQSFKFLRNLIAQPWLLVLLLAGLGLLIYGAMKTAKSSATSGIWFAGPGTVLIGLTVLLLPALNNTPFYPSLIDPQMSLTIYNASSSPYTLRVMTYVALGIPLVLGYITYVWWAMNRRKITIEDTTDHGAY
ncbi:MAG: cytochrome d ubiquinol oxidase subunit II [Desulfobulbus sp.]|jgi:cytochrome d ubiquinol oxidase subunit II